MGARTGSHSRVSSGGFPLQTYFCVFSEIGRGKRSKKRGYRVSSTGYRVLNTKYQTLNTKY